MALALSCAASERRAVLVFDGAYHMGSFSGAVCMPSRHMIMSGRTVWHLPVSPGAKDHCPPGIENSPPRIADRR